MARSLDFVRKEIARVARELGVHPGSLIRDEFLKNTGEVTKNDIAFYGGWAKVRFDAATESGDFPEVDVPTVRGIEIRNSYYRNLERKVASADYFSDRVVASLKGLLYDRPLQVKQVPKHKEVKKGTSYPTLLLSDLHFGVDVHDYEVHGANYSWGIASRRMAYLAKRFVDYCHNTPGGVSEVRVILNGDIMHGIIHMTEANIRPMTEQIVGSLQILNSAVQYIHANTGAKLRVVCLPGNHDRMNYRGTDRALTQRWDSFATLLYVSLQAAFKEVPDVRVEIPSSGIGLLEDCKEGFILVTHGDTAPNIGNIARAIDVDKIATNILRVESSKAIGKPISAVLFGHWHTPTMQMLPTGQVMVINGSLIGSDSYSQNAIGAFNSVPAQVMFRTGESAVEDLQVVQVRCADVDSSLETIIPSPTVFMGDLIHGIG